MYSFLQNIAKVFYEKEKDNLRQLVFVFPNRRAGIFFRHYLARYSKTPVFSPQIQTISELFESLSPYAQADRIDLIMRLFEIYRKNVREDEEFDSFVYWGQILLSDFSEVDQQLVDARLLYANLRDQRDIDRLFAATTEEEKQQSIAIFFRGFQKEHQNEYRERFHNIWSRLFPIYKELREQLASDGLAYSGMLQRYVVEKWNEGMLQENKTFVFVGFNALTEVERRLFTILKVAGKADFYWDYGSSFLTDNQNRASFFAEENLRLFPSHYEIDNGTSTNQLPAVSLIKAQGGVGQAQALFKTLDKCAEQDWTRTGVILADETLISPVLNAIPPKISAVNVTMGLAFTLTPVFSLLTYLKQLEQMQAVRSGETVFYYKPVVGILKHQYIRDVVDEQVLQALQQQIQKDNLIYVPEAMLTGNDVLSLVFSTSPTTKDLLERVRLLLLSLSDTEAYRQVSPKNDLLYHALMAVQRLQTIWLRYDYIAANSETVLSMLISLLRPTTIPFEGEPVAGLQVMGMLESRAMDFDNLIIVGANDEYLPGKNRSDTFIPYDLRVAFHLPTPERQDSVYAYNFYRLFSHAQTVTFISDVSTDELHSAEVSRYVYQLNYQYNIPINEQTTATNVQLQIREPLEIIKDETVMAALRAKMQTQNGISPSAINDYIKCPLLFYLNYIQRLRVPDKLQEDIPANVFGTIVHDVIGNLYEKTLKDGGNITEDVLNNIENEIKTSQALEQSFRKHFLKAGRRITGQEQIYMDVMRRYLLSIVETDRQYVPFKYIASEKKYNHTVKLKDGSVIKLNGTVDRIDMVDGKLRIVDYKTGGVKTLNKVDEVFTKIDSKLDHIRQTLLYAFLYNQNVQTQQDAELHIYYVSKPPYEMDQKVGTSDVATFSQLWELSEKSFYELLEEIMSGKIAFIANLDDDQYGHCKYCQFAQLCGVKTA